MGKDKDNVIDDKVKKYKKRLKRMCLCATFWIIFAISSLIVGILMLVYFTKYWGDDTNWRRGLAYLGVVLLLVFLLSLAIGVIISVILKKIYKRMEGGDRGMGKMFKPKAYAPGTAPYPQQPPEAPQRTVPPIADPNISPSRVPLQPGPQAAPSAPPAGRLEEVNIEVSDHSKF